MASSWPLSAAGGTSTVDGPESQDQVVMGRRAFTAAAAAAVAAAAARTASAADSPSLAVDSSAVNDILRRGSTSSTDSSAKASDSSPDIRSILEAADSPPAPSASAPDPLKSAPAPSASIAPASSDSESPDVIKLVRFDTGPEVCEDPILDSIDLFIPGWSELPKGCDHFHAFWKMSDDVFNDKREKGTSKASVAIKDGKLIFDGEIEKWKNNPIHPSRPGWAVARNPSTSYHVKSQKYPNITSCEGISFVARSDVPYAGYSLSMGIRATPDSDFVAETYKEGYKARFDAPQNGWGTVKIPFTAFTNLWNNFTGDAVVPCVQSPDNKKRRQCLDFWTLRNMRIMQFWAEGVTGKYHLEVKEVNAYGCGEGTFLPYYPRRRKWIEYIFPNFYTPYRAQAEIAKQLQNGGPLPGTIEGVNSLGDINNAARLAQRQLQGGENLVEYSIFVEANSTRLWRPLAASCSGLGLVCFAIMLSRRRTAPITQSFLG